MSYSPVLPFGGYTGWAYIARTRETQQAHFAASAEVKRETDYFREKIGGIDSAEELVKDRRLLSVALGAFGLQDDINNKYFIQKVLADGTLDTGDLANRLSNKSYLDMASAFGFGDYTVPSTKISTFADDIIGKYEERQFEVALGEVNDTMRLALNAQRELATIAGASSSETTKWYTVLGSPPLREVFETAFNLPSTFAAVDLDLQLKTIRERAEQYTGSADVSQFTDPAKVESLIKMFTLRAGDSGTSAGLNSGLAALSLLQGGSSASAGLLAILAAR